MSGILDYLGKNTNPLTGEQYSDTYRELAKKWSKLPAYEDAAKIIKQIENNSVLLVVSGTGSGKTVLLPKYMLHVLNYKGKIAVSLPKQIIAEDAAKYAAATLDVPLGQHVGYQFRGSGKHHTSETNLMYCTDGTLVARLLSDPELKEFDAVVIDEAHERKVNIDFLLYLLKNVLRYRPEFKLIIMSATINNKIFSNYFSEFKYKNISIGTKPNYEIKSVFLKKELDVNKNEYIEEGIKLINKLLDDSKKKNKDNNTNTGILFFVTSVNETKKVCEMLENNTGDFKGNHICIPVFSGMAEDKQKIAVDGSLYREYVSNTGVKIIIATNVAESSLTIDGIKSVIDSGLELKSSYDYDKRINILEKKLITHAQATQRMGRTGRTCPGTCYHLYTKKFFDKMEEFPLPSIRNESISYEMMRLLNMSFINNINNLKQTLNEFLEPPDKHNVNTEIAFLYSLKLIDSTDNNGVLTKLGKSVIDLQTDPMMAITMIAAYKLQCYQEVLAIINIIETVKGSIDSLFFTGFNEDDGAEIKSNKIFQENVRKAREHFGDKSGDYISLLNIYIEYEETLKAENVDSLNKFIKKYSLNKFTLDKIYKKFQIMKFKFYNLLQKIFNIVPAEPQIETSTGLSTEIPTETPVDNTLANEYTLNDRIIASFQFGHRMNTFKCTDRQIKSKNINNLEIDASSFVKIKDDDKYVLFCMEFYRINNNPVKAKIISLTNEQTNSLVDKLDEII